MSYNLKHNEANGEDNRDGHNDNLSWNCGVEGPTDDPTILALRRRQARNFIAILMLSQGVPMLRCGDEVLQSKQGNNNSYCQNNAISWFDWNLLDDNCGMHDFVRGMIAFRQRHPTLHRSRFLTGEPANGQTLPDIAWHGVELDAPDWDDPAAQSLAFTLAGITAEQPPLHIMLNMGKAPLELAVPQIQGWSWSVAIDTDREPSIMDHSDPSLSPGSRVRVAHRSLMVLEGRAA